MREIIEQILERVPLNNFTKIRHAAGKEVPQALGGNCIYQHRLLVEDIFKAKPGAIVSYLPMRRLPHHHAVLVQLDGEKWFLDSSYFLRDPVSLDQLFAVRQHVEVESYPLRNGIPDKWVFEVDNSFAGENDRFQFRRPAADSGGNFKLSDEVSTIPAIDDKDIAFLTKGNGDKFVFQGLDTSDGGIIHFKFDIEGRDFIDFRKRGGSDKRPLSSEEVMVLFTERFRMEIDELFDVLNETADLYFAGMKARAEKKAEK